MLISFRKDYRTILIRVSGNFGGVCGLFIGFSIISIVELLYFVTIRYYCALREYN